MGQSNPHNPPVALVVEDEALIRFHTVDLLEDEGYEVLDAGSADAALKVLERRGDEVGLLLTDVNMPGRLDGLELVELVHRRWPHMLLVVSSGRRGLTSEDIPDDGRFIGKPYHPDQLLGALRDLRTKHLDH